MNYSAVIRTIALVALFLTATLPALACSAAGPNTHVGKVLSVDESAGTFTLLDAETMSPVTLIADAALLNQASSISGSVVVTYERNGDILRALKIK